MSGEREKIGMPPDYATALGVAVYAFADLEWNAIRACESIEPGIYESLAERTAGNIADKLISLAKSLKRSADREELVAAAERFQILVRSRNNLFHSRPDVDGQGSERLFRNGDPWEIWEMEAIADKFAICSLELERLIGAYLEA